MLLTDSIEKVSGIGSIRSKALKEFGVQTAFDLLRIAPKRYEDRTNLLPLSSLFERKLPFAGLFQAKLISRTIKHIRRNMCIVSAVFSDSGSKSVQARWFNQPYLFKNLKESETYYLFGEVVEFGGKPQFENPEIERINDEETSPNASGCLTPIYPSSKVLSKAKLSPRLLRKIICGLFQTIDWQASFPNFDGPFPKIQQALLDLHRPLDLSKAKHANNTMVFLDHVLFQLGVLVRRESITGNFRSQYSLDVGEFEPGFSLPFVLTGEQKRTLGEILFDLSQPFPMNRLLQGEVGSGKTLVAFLAMRHLSEGIYRGSQCAFLAPTEILARQHAQNFSRYFPEVASRVGLLTGSLSKSAKNEVLEKIRLARFSYIFGTHALFQEKVMIPGLNFCIIDEQHRFGVSQRRSLIEKGKERFPHLLLMTATPIPRSLSLTIFGDMDVSTIKELPPGRKPIKTKLAKSREEALQEMKRHLANGGQTYFICPLIENSEKNQWVSVEEALSRLTKAFPEYKVAAITGKQSSDEKNLAIDLFHSGKIQILVATTVLEVGIDNPNATVMVIENAERFGLSQLHQLRGRIGRGTVSSICILVSPSGEDCERLSVFSEINDGFLLSAEDLRFRGAGDILGTKQSGFSRQIFSQLGRLDIIEKARERALSILTNELPETREWFLDRMRESFGGDFDDFLKGG